MTRAETAESLSEFLEPDETAAQLLQRVSVEPLLTKVHFIDRRIRLRPNHLALISGCSGSGKTELLVQVGFVNIMHVDGASLNIFVVVTVSHRTPF